MQHPCTGFHYYSLFQQFFAETRYLFADVNRKNLVAHRTAGDYTNNRNRDQKNKPHISHKLKGHINESIFIFPEPQQTLCCRRTVSCLFRTGTELHHARLRAAGFTRGLRAGLPDRRYAAVRAVDRLSRHRPAVRSGCHQMGTQTRVPHPVLCIRGRLCHAADQRLAGLAAGGHVPDRHFQGRYHGLQQPRNERIRERQRDPAQHDARGVCIWCVCGAAGRTRLP